MMHDVLLPASTQLLAAASAQYGQAVLSTPVLALLHLAGQEPDAAQVQQAAQPGCNALPEYTEDSLTGTFRLGRHGFAAITTAVTTLLLRTSLQDHAAGASICSVGRPPEGAKRGRL